MTDFLRSELEHLLHWYEEKETQHPGSVTRTAEVIMDLRNVLSDALEIERELAPE